MTRRQIAALVLGGAALVFLPGWWRWEQWQAKAARLQQEIVALDAENRRLVAEQERLLNDPLYLERIARSKLGLARKGEIVLKVAPPTDSAE